MAEHIISNITTTLYTDDYIPEACVIKDITKDNKDLITNVAYRYTDKPVSFVKWGVCYLNSEGKYRNRKGSMRTYESGEEVNGAFNLSSAQTYIADVDETANEPMYFFVYVAACKDSPDTASIYPTEENPIVYDVIITSSEPIVEEPEENIESDKYVINKTSLTAIGDSIRAAKGESKWKWIENDEATILYGTFTKNDLIRGECLSLETLGLEDFIATRNPVIKLIAKNLYPTSTYRINFTDYSNPDFTGMMRNNGIFQISGSSSYNGQAQINLSFWNQRPTLTPYRCLYLPNFNNDEEYTIYFSMEKQIDEETTYLPSEMAGEIDGIAEKNVPDSAFTLTGNLQHRFAHNGWNWFLEKFGDKIKIENPSSYSDMFNNSDKLTNIPFDLPRANNSLDYSKIFYYCSSLTSLLNLDIYAHSVDNMFGNSSSLEKISGNIELYTTSTSASGQPSCNSLFTYCSKLKDISNLRITGNIGAASQMFYNCNRLREIPEEVLEGITFNYQDYAYINRSNMFSGCNSLRQFPMQFYSKIVKNSITTSGSYHPYYQAFNNCYVLDEIRDIPVNTNVTLTSNVFSNNTFQNLNRAKIITFEKDSNGQPLNVKWKNQVIDLTTYVGHTTYPLDLSTNYNSGISADKNVCYAADGTTQLTTYEAIKARYDELKNDPDWGAATNKQVNCPDGVDRPAAMIFSRYNLSSAKITIESLPHTVSGGGNNTIKFKRESGLATDKGAVGDLPNEYISLANTKGWTVAFS